MAQNQTFLKEWAPLTDLFQKLPTKTGGIFSQDIKLTCVDVLPEFLVLGTNVGIIYWYDRKRKDLQRLRCENANLPICFVKAVSTVDYMVACGNQTGNITIFQIPKSHPDSLPENLKPKQKQVERYTVTDLHKSAITAMEWSKNGMKLFSGDKRGTIVLTEIDFYMHMCKSIEILNESYEVVQLSYNQQRLLVSTTFRSIICQQCDKWKVCQVGKKDRKVLGSFGGLVFQHGFKPSDVVLYCTRPGLRMWIADIEGNVQKTLLFKDLLLKDCSRVPILNPISKGMQQLKPQQEPSFGILLPFCDNLLVTYNNDVVYILDPTEMTILATVTHLRSILDIATFKDEIFILEEERSLLRISFQPETEIFSPVNASSTKPLSSGVTPIKDTFQAATDLFTSSFIPQGNKNDPINIHTDDTSILNAEEAQESPEEDVKKFDDIGKQDFEENILFKKTKKTKKRSKSKMTASTTSLSSNSSEEKDLSYTRPTIMNLSAVGVLPDLRSPESIINDIEYKEKILADVLSLDKIKFSASKDKLQEKKKTNQEMEKREDMKLAGNSFCIPNYMNIVKDDVSATKKGVLPIASVKSIPNEWNLGKVQVTKKQETKKTAPIKTPAVTKRQDSANNDSLLSDWEIV